MSAQLKGGELPAAAAAGDSERLFLAAARAAQFSVAALLNDSVGTLAGGCYGSEDAKLGIILGTGTNACYVERTASLGTLTPEQRAGSRAEMLVNTEWGNFNARSLPISQVWAPFSALPPLPASALLRRAAWGWSLFQELWPGSWSSFLTEAREPSAA